MNRTIGITTKVGLLGVSLAAMLALAAPRDANAQIVLLPPPPPAFVAITPPEYYLGHPTYYYHDSWYYRGGGGWHYYRSEPGYLRGRREHWEHRRGYRYYR